LLRALRPNKSSRRDNRRGEKRPQAKARFYDFNVWSEKKRLEKLNYMHGNPVKRALVESPEQWGWSSYRHYFLGEAGRVQVNVGWGEISFRDHAA
jgi:putative transposase